MPYNEKSLFFKLGLVTLIYSILLLFQGLWLQINYLSIYPTYISAPMVPSGYQPYYGTLIWLGIMGIYFPTLAALIISFRLMTDKQQSKTLGVGLFFFAFSVALLVQNIWALFGFAHFYKELGWYTTNGIFVNYPRFFALLGAVLPTIAGFFLFCLIGLRLIVIHYRKTNLAPS